MDMIIAEKNDKRIIDDIVNRLKNLEIGIIPTDTVYGLVGIAEDKQVKHRIYNIKQRDVVKQLVLQIGINYDLTKIVSNISLSAKKLMKNFFPGPLTLIFKASCEFINKYNWEIDTVGIRIPRHELFLAILNKLNKPLFVTSSNISGKKNINDKNFLQNQFENKVDFFVDDKKDYGDVPSTIVDVSGDTLKILREGVIKKFQIMEVLENED